MEKRRLTDQVASIESLIEREDDPKQRAFLIILNSINNSLIANTETTVEVSTKLDRHLTSYEKHTRDQDAIRNKGMGAWGVVTKVLVVLQAVAIWAATALYGNLSKMSEALAAAQVVEERQNARLDSHDAYLRNLLERIK